jgi:hypothetical protein
MPSTTSGTPKTIIIILDDRARRDAPYAWTTPPTGARENAPLDARRIARVVGVVGVVGAV